MTALSELPILLKGEAGVWWLGVKNDVTSCAKSSIASYSLYCELRKKGFAFKELRVSITMADGVQRPQTVLVTQAPVKTSDHTVPTTFLVLPGSRHNRTLLGVGFIEDAHIVLNLPQYTWFFIEDPFDEFELYEESFVKFGEGDKEAYVRNCIYCQRYKASNQKPAGLLQTTAQNQRFEVVAFDLFGPLPRTAANQNWILIIEDVATRWVELFALERATAEECAKILLDEVVLRYGTPRRFA
ncbi:uncharacterized protein LOC126973434 [Leptidea sinapis]|uniref:uncharacterized protein LOC126973434 n=1 Tax=Leptidea sinapis TaxID=189913 RepID=UPI0021C2B37F|nr:uncharacterized protein LOC126973434 [Leptidea sinapis]